MTVCRDIGSGVDWAKVRKHVDQQLASAGFKAAVSTRRPDPATWGLAPEQIAAQERAMKLGAGGGSAAPPDASPD